VMDAFMSRERCVNLLALMNKSPSSFRYGMNVFLGILKCISEAAPPIDVLEDIHSQPYPHPDSPLVDLPTPIQVLVENLTNFCNVLLQKNTKNGDTQITMSDSFGFVRLRIIQVTTALLGLHFTAVNSSILESDILPIAIDLVFNFPQNNFAHQAIDALYARMWEVIEGDNRSKCLQKTNLASRLISAEDENAQREENGLARQPYMAFLHQMAMSLEKAADSESLKGKLESTEGWTDYIRKVHLVSEPLTEAQRRGYVPRGMFRMF